MAEEVVQNMSPCMTLPQDAEADRSHKTSSLIISEFVGCSPSMSGAIRVNPWSVDNVADGIYSAIKMSKAGSLQLQVQLHHGEVSHTWRVSQHHMLQLRHASQSS